MFRADAPLQSDFVQEPSSSAAFTQELSAEAFQAVFKIAPKETAATSLDLSATIMGYDDKVILANLPAQDPPFQPDEQPEDRLSSIFISLPENPTPKELADALHSVADAMSDQLDNVDATQAEYKNYPGLDTLLPSSQKEYETAYYALNPELQKDKSFVNTLATLPNLIYSGQADTASTLMTGMLQLAGPQGREQLQAYFDKLKSVATQNPDIVNEYTEKFQTFNQELRTFDDMNRRYKDSRLWQ